MKVDFFSTVDIIHEPEVQQGEENRYISMYSLVYDVGEFLMDTLKEASNPIRRPSVQNCYMIPSAGVRMPQAQWVNIYSDI